jgi:hypothetical protein
MLGSLLSPLASAAPLPFAPLYGGDVVTAPGADAEFRRIANDWQGSQIVWKDPDPIGTYAWGTGLWGQADWQRVMAGEVPAVQQWSGAVDQINFGNARYNECYAGTWGLASLSPFFSNTVTGADCSDAEAGAPSQQNWVTHFSGLIRITDPGAYNFSVLYDDGFFFRLVGADGQALDIGQDFLNPRQREGFDDDLLLTAGLYGFELGSWNRLGAGVVDLRWSREGGQWELVPVDNLARLAQAVPEPPALALLAAALGIGAWLRRRRA